ncbi:hypothetical protein MRX96_036702 [Rhipicephalus microplus]
MPVCVDIEGVQAEIFPVVDEFGFIVFDGDAKLYTTAEAEDGKVQLAVGDRFGTFEDLEACISRFSAENCVQLWKRDARTIAAAKNRVGKLASKMSESLKYYQLRYCCIHGGAKFISTNKGARKSLTFKRDCSFNIYIAAEKEGKFLEVRSLDLTHNHPVDQELFRHLPQQRRLAPELQNKARELMKMKAQQDDEWNNGIKVVVRQLFQLHEQPSRVLKL